MTTPALPALTLEDLKCLTRYAQLRPPREPFEAKHRMQVFQHPHVRWELVVERTGDIGYGLAREDSLGAHGIFGAELDAESFAKNLWEAVGDHLSLREAERLLEVLTADVAARRERIEAARQHLDTLPR
jgi:hypothetical protein